MCACMCVRACVRVLLFAMTHLLSEQPWESLQLALLTLGPQHTARDPESRGGLGTLQRGGHSGGGLKREERRGLSNKRDEKRQESGRNFVEVVWAYSC